MNIYFETSPITYLKKVEPLLLQREANNNLILGLLGRAVERESDAELHLGVVEEEGEIMYAFMQTAPHDWILADAGIVDEPMIRKIVNVIIDAGLEIPGVHGPSTQATIFKEFLVKEHGRTMTKHMGQLIYQLDHVQLNPQVEGRLELATDEDVDLFTDWLWQFGQEANEPIARERARGLAETMIQHASLYKWVVADKPVSMVNQSRKTRHGTTINAVFTPNAHKRKGYATAAVASLSQQLLEEGFQFCSLYTDASNPTSNNIYQRIGYNQVGKAVVYKTM
ncbi:GNAT family N-acetyltransferase [Ornithinibacillus gellani]|uniref:GNAT family N-acetyltransferase n=1 Tax=Ornithinibacillus gellani TaxID=2293253 RepID=UPI000F484553|nr:GNAT family N-acetyltransferase [Ornithinibacillus gellani]TQS72094.1 GNAT family N-acetyltransferase [Ornithinibacillus gellani]